MSAHNAYMSCINNVLIMNLILLNNLLNLMMTRFYVLIVNLFVVNLILFHNLLLIQMLQIMKNNLYVNWDINLRFLKFLQYIVNLKDMQIILNVINVKSQEIFKKKNVTIVHNVNITYMKNANLENFPENFSVKNVKRQENFKMVLLIVRDVNNSCIKNVYKQLYLNFNVMIVKRQEKFKMVHISVESVFIYCMKNAYKEIKIEFNFYKVRI